MAEVENCIPITPETIFDRQRVEDGTVSRHWRELPTRTIEPHLPALSSRSRLACLALTR